MNDQPAVGVVVALQLTFLGKRRGIMGTGTIGRQIAKSAGCFALEVTGLSLSGNAVPGFERVRPDC